MVDGLAIGSNNLFASTSLRIYRGFALISPTELYIYLLAKEHMSSQCIKPIAVIMLQCSVNKISIFVFSIVNPAPNIYLCILSFSAGYSKGLSIICHTMNGSFAILMDGSFIISAGEFYPIGMNGGFILHGE